MTTEPRKRGRGRPRNPALDELERELVVSRRRAASVLKEMKTKQATTSENSEKPLSPLAAARLQKLEKEIVFLETRIRSAQLEQRELERELIHTDGAMQLINAGVGPIAAALRTLAKFMAPRLVGQPQVAIERILTTEANRILKLANGATNDFCSKYDRPL